MSRQQDYAAHSGCRNEGSLLARAKHWTGGACSGCTGAQQEVQYPHLQPPPGPYVLAAQEWHAAQPLLQPQLLLLQHQPRRFAAAAVAPRTWVAVAAVSLPAWRRRGSLCCPETLPAWPQARLLQLPLAAPRSEVAGQQVCAAEAS